VHAVRFYRSPAGSRPVEEFLDTLSGKQAQKVIWVLRLIGDLDRVPGQYFKKLTDTQDLWEVRVQHGGATFRIFGFFDITGRLILTNGFAKKRDRIPRREIEVAESRRDEYLSRSRDDE
jgi:phage-related protein